LDLQRLDLGPPVRRVPALVADRSRREDEARHAEQDDEKRYRDASGARGTKPAMSCRVHVENYPLTSSRRGLLLEL
jgi:hypothetical protein